MRFVVGLTVAMLLLFCTESWANLGSKIEAVCKAVLCDEQDTFMWDWSCCGIEELKNKNSIQDDLGVCCLHLTPGFKSVVSIGSVLAFLVCLVGCLCWCCRNACAACLPTSPWR